MTINAANKNEIKSQLKDFLSQFYGLKSINDTDNIFETGGMNSLFFIQLLVFIEKKFHIELTAGEFDIDKLISVQAIADLVNAKLNPLAVSLC